MRMGRRWSSFDQETTNAEFRTIPDRDLADLFRAMKRWVDGLERGFIVKNYGDGLLMIKATNKTAGRCLFFTLDEEDPTLAVALLGYKKESSEAPSHLIEAARGRRARFLENRS